MEVIRPCRYCDQAGTLVYVIPDSDYGYGYDATLCCGKCEPTNIFCDVYHTYDPDRDDYFLGYTEKLPLSWVFMNKTEFCHDCKNIIPTSKRGHGSVWKGSTYIHDVYYCMDCFRKRDGDNDISTN